MNWVPKKQEISRAVRGIHPVMEGLNRGIAFEGIYVLRTSQNERLEEVITNATQFKVPVHYVGPEAFSPFGKTSQGVFGLIKNIKVPFESVEDLIDSIESKQEPKQTAPSLDEQTFKEKTQKEHIESKESTANIAQSQSKTVSQRSRLLLLLDGITDPHNLGAISRCAFYFGVEGIILPKKGSVGLTDTVHKVSAGASLMMNYCQVGSLKLALQSLKERYFSVYTTGVSKEGEDLRKTEFSKHAVIVMGSEGKGVKRNLSNLADGQISIMGNVLFDSLNVSVATGIILYQFNSQFDP